MIGVTVVPDMHVNTLPLAVIPLLLILEQWIRDIF